MSKIFASCLLCLILIGLVACGGGSKTTTTTPTPTPAATPTALAVSPNAVSVGLGGSQVFSATGTSVTWSVSGPGTIAANGAYLAPASFATAGPVTAIVTATAGTQTATATVTIIYPNDNAGNETTPIHLGTSGGNILDNDTTNTHCCIGTLGSLINRGGTLFILSNNHVLARSDLGVAGETIDQPGEPRCPAGSQGLPVANLTEKTALKPAGGVTTGNAPSNVDAAIAQIVTASVDTTGAILDLGAAGANGIAAAPPLTIPSDPKVVLGANRGVAKSGRTTGLTCSQLLAVSVDNVQVGYAATCGGTTAFTAIFNGQVQVNGGTFSAEGDSGSLIVTSDTSSPVALLYGGNPTSTFGNPILDSTDSRGNVAKGVLSAFNNGTAPTFVGTTTPHAVSCAPTAQAQSTQAAAQSTPVTAAKMQTASAVRGRHLSDLMALDSAIRSVDVGGSSDAPGEAAVVIHVSGALKNRVPATLEGVRTRIVYADGSAPSGMSDVEFGRGLVAKDNHKAEYFKTGFQGIGVGLSDDAPGESTIVINTIKGAPHAAIPATIDGVRTKVVDGEPFRASHWNPKLESKVASCSKQASASQIKNTLK